MWPRQWKNTQTIFLLAYGSHIDRNCVLTVTAAHDPRVTENLETGARKKHVLERTERVTFCERLRPVLGISHSPWLSDNINVKM